MTHTEMTGLDDKETARYAVDEAVLLLQDWFGRKAGRLSKDNISLIEDVIQEMSMGVLLCHGENTLSFYKQQAVFRARNYLKQERRHNRKAERVGRLSLPKLGFPDEPFVEGLIDLQDRMSTRAERMDRITDYYTETDARETA